MRVMLFQGGQAGIVYNLPGENPMVEIEELLCEGQDVCMTRINRRLALVEVEDKTLLPTRYVLERMGKTPRLIRGDCIVVRAGQDQRLGDLNATDAVEAQSCVRPLGVTT